MDIVEQGKFAPLCGYVSHFWGEDRCCRDFRAFEALLGGGRRHWSSRTRWRITQNWLQAGPLLFAASALKRVEAGGLDWEQMCYYIPAPLGYSCSQ